MSLFTTWIPAPLWHYQRLPERFQRKETSRWIFSTISAFGLKPLISLLSCTLWGCKQIHKVCVFNLLCKWNVAACRHDAQFFWVLPSLVSTLPISSLKGVRTPETSCVFVPESRKHMVLGLWLAHHLFRWNCDTSIFTFSISLSLTNCTADKERN